ncbi:MAG: YbjN domain-containing protein [Pseudomonadota bacterium]|nr:YbjN domain-containing protein [Pseudomonadota bacterium]
MTSLAADTGVSTANPLDIVEEILTDRQWSWERTADTEVAMEVHGQWCVLTMALVWHPEARILHFSCHYDLRVPPGRKVAVHDLLATINGRLWAGHFDLDTESLTPAFRYGLMLRGTDGVTGPQAADILDMAMAECDRFYPAFQFVIWGGKPAAEAMNAALFETVGEA